MSAAPQFNFPEPQEFPRPDQPELQIHQPAESSTQTSEDIQLAGMLIASIAFAVAFGALVVVPYMSQWLAL